MKAILFFLFLTFNLFASITKVTGVSMQSNTEIDFTTKDHFSVIIFISKDCPCSKGNLSYINDLSKNYPEIKFLGIHAKKGSTTEQLRNYLSDKNLNFEVINDPEMKMTKKFEALKTPHAFILNPKGEIVYNGGVTSSTFPENAKTFFLNDRLEEIKNHKPISMSESKTLGCFIVR